MGYFAQGAGTIYLKESLPEKIKRDFEYEYGYADIYGNALEFSGSGNYHEDDVTKLLNGIIPYAESGYVEYTGEDDTHWRFVLSNGEWNESNGRVVYDDEPRLSLNNSDKAEFIGTLIDKVEDVLGKEDPFIVGEKYDKLKTAFTDVLHEWNVL